MALIAFSFTAIIVISIVYMNISKDTERGDRLFNALLPLLSTWVGTVLVFYFGKESFESASKKYEQIINKLSPELLGGVPARQVMIDKFTMVSLQVTDPCVVAASSRALLDFLDSIDKTRLPVMIGSKITYHYTSEHIYR